MKNKSVKFIAQAGIIAALYIALTYINPFSYYDIQVRISEALCVLPMFTPAAVPGLFIGCLTANLIHGCHILDIIFGSLATLLAAFLTLRLKKNQYLALIPPVLVNAVIVGLIVSFCYGSEMILPLVMLSIGAGQLVACYGLGLPLYYIFKKNPSIFNKDESKDNQK